MSLTGNGYEPVATSPSIPSDPGNEAMMRKRFQQIAIRSLAGGATDVVYSTGVQGQPLTIPAQQGGFMKGAVSVAGADLFSDWLVSGSAWAKAAGHFVPERLLSEPVIGAVIHYLYARFIQGQGQYASLPLEAALGAIAVLASDQMSKFW